MSHLKEAAFSTQANSCLVGHEGPGAAKSSDLCFQENPEIQIFR